MRFRWTFATVAFLSLVACVDKQPKPTQTQRERDSLVGQSRLPGAQGVAGALQVADSASARADRAANIR